MFENHIDNVALMEYWINLEFDGMGAKAEGKPEFDTGIDFIIGTPMEHRGFYSILGNAYLEGQHAQDHFFGSHLLPRPNGGVQSNIVARQHTEAAKLGAVKYISSIGLCEKEADFLIETTNLYYEFIFLEHYI
jgi:hypothetical protein